MTSKICINIKVTSRLKNTSWCQRFIITSKIGQNVKKYCHDIKTFSGRQKYVTTSKICYKMCQDVKKTVTTLKSKPQGQINVMTSKSTSWLQKVRQESNIASCSKKNITISKCRSWHQKLWKVDHKHCHDVSWRN